MPGVRAPSFLSVGPVLPPILPLLIFSLFQGTGGEDAEVETLRTKIREVEDARAAAVQEASALRTQLHSAGDQTVVCLLIFW